MKNCDNCIKQKTMLCPNSILYYSTEEKNHYVEKNEKAICDYIYNLQQQRQSIIEHCKENIDNTPRVMDENRCKQIGKNEAYEEILNLFK